jgi:hypothetical protein
MFIEKGFPFFEPFFARLASKFEKVLILPLKKKISKCLKKRRISR